MKCQTTNCETETDVDHILITRLSMRSLLQCDLITHHSRQLVHLQGIWNNIRITTVTVGITIQCYHYRGHQFITRLTILLITKGQLVILSNGPQIYKHNLWCTSLGLELALKVTYSTTNARTNNKLRRFAIQELEHLRRGGLIYELKNTNVQRWIMKIGSQVLPLNINRFNDASNDVFADNYHLFGLYLV